MTKVSEHAETDGITVEVKSFFVPEHSEPQAGQYFFSYHIRIKNDGESTIQLMSRHWIITDGNGRVEEVKGPGVVGQQPRLAPGEEFEYESFCPLPTPTGTMRGSYQCVVLDEKRASRPGRVIEVEIPQFFLVEPSCFH